MLTVQTDPIMRSLMRVRAVLALDQIDFKKHSAVISYFQKNYVKTGIFEPIYSDIIRDAFSIRQDCDYEDFFVISIEESIEQVENSRIMIDAVKNYVDAYEMSSENQEDINLDEKQ